MLLAFVSDIGRFICQTADQRERHYVVSATSGRMVPARGQTKRRRDGTPPRHRGLCSGVMEKEAEA
jgi:hypothetical protein